MFSEQKPKKAQPHAFTLPAEKLFVSELESGTYVFNIKYVDSLQL